MLKTLRKKGVAKKILWFVAIIIIISFGFFGTAYMIQGNGQPTYAGKIFNHKISLDKFERMYQHTQLQAMIRYGDKFREARPFLNLEAETWDRLILLEEANRRHIKVSDKEVIETIKQYSFFQRDGQFDTLLYNDILRYSFRTEARDFEESVRDTLMFGKLLDQEASATTLTEDEVFAAYKKQNEKVQVSYCLISTDSFKNDVNYDESQAQQYYAEHKDEFRIPPSINVDFIRFDYKDNIEETEKAELKQKATSVYQALLINPDIQEIAKKDNLNLQTSGFFSVDQPNLSLGWPFELQTYVSQLETNRINEPFETSKGIFIVKVKEKKDSQIPDYAQVKDKVKEAFLKIKAKDIAKLKAQEYLKSLKEELNKSKIEDFQAAAKQLGLEIYQTPGFNRGDYLPKVGIAKEFQEAAFSLTENNTISDVVETENGYCILHLNSYIPVDKEVFAKEKEKFAQNLFMEKRNEIFSNFLSGLRLKANLVDNLPKNKN